ENLIRHLTAKRLEQLEFFRRRRPARHHIGILERRMGARIGAVHDGLVGPFEIKRLDQCLAHARVLEFVAAGIDEPALRPRWWFIRPGFAFDAAVAHGRKIITRRPYPRSELLAIEVIPASKSLEGDVAVPVEFVAHDIEIIVAAGDGKIAAPPVLDPFGLDEAIDLELSDLVGAGAKRSIE